MQMGKREENVMMRLQTINECLWAQPPMCPPHSNSKPVVSSSTNKTTKTTKTTGLPPFHRPPLILPVRFVETAGGSGMQLLVLTKTVNNK
jgi:hypothetical protein